MTLKIGYCRGRFDGYPGNAGLQAARRRLSEGRHLEIRHFNDQTRFKEVTAPDHAAEIVDPVMDQANTLIFMINPPYALMAR